MEYRKIPSLDVRPSLLGYGCMRFPTLPQGGIDEPAAKAMLDRAMQGGVNYFDTAYFYHDGASEAFTARALADYPRDRYFFTSKLPTTMVHSLEDARRIYAEQMARLKVDYLDFYLLHNLNGPRFREMVELGVVDWCLDLQKRGAFRYFGFSFHGSYEEFREILTARKWDVCQIQLNYMDTDEQAGLAGYGLTEELRVPLIIMEPVKGGALADPPSEVMELLTEADPVASAASWALRWAGSLPNVMTVLSGMSTMAQVENNLQTFSPFHPLTEGEKETLELAAAKFRARVKNGCTGCRYCMPCPAGVDIPANFKLWNEYGVYTDVSRTAHKWKELTGRADACISCGVCEKKCPQKLSIPADLGKMKTELDALAT